MEEKVRAIKEAPPQAMYHSFLGLVNYYSKFSPNLANTLAPCIISFRKPSNGHGKPHRKIAFEEAKRQLTSQNLLVHFDQSKELIVSYMGCLPIQHRGRIITCDA